MLRNLLCPGFKTNSWRQSHLPGDTELDRHGRLQDADTVLQPAHECDESHPKLQQKQIGAKLKAGQNLAVGVRSSDAPARGD